MSLPTECQGHVLLQTPLDLHRGKKALQASSLSGHTHKALFHKFPQTLYMICLDAFAFFCPSLFLFGGNRRYTTRVAEQTSQPDAHPDWHQSEHF